MAYNGTSLQQRMANALKHSQASPASRPRCAVVGAANIDIGGFPSGRLAIQDSNPGRVMLSAGGVGRNIACNLARLGVETYLIAALGDDAFADIIRKDCANAGVLTDLCPTFEGEAGSAYLFIADALGEMQLAVNDMRICDRLSPPALMGCLDALNAMDAVVLDANLPAGALEFLAERLRVPLLADAVSTAKAPRLLGALPRLRAIKPNALEAETLTGIPIHDVDTAIRAARRLTEMGASRAFVTLGERGVCCAGDGEEMFLPGPAVRLVNATGAGDAFAAALAWGELRGLSLRECAQAGMAAASIAVESMATVNPELSEQALYARIEEIKNSGGHTS